MTNLVSSPNRLIDSEEVHVNVPTSTAVVYRSDDPYWVVVGRNEKHEEYVLPGGKIDRDDLQCTSLERAAFCCICRELREELGISACEPTLLHVQERLSGDVRPTNAGRLRETVVDELVGSYPDEHPIVAHYGVPDYLFVVRATGEKVGSSSEEFLEIRWIHLRDSNRPKLIASHEELVEKYLEWTAESRL
jgi:8-oxo-dGTP pyrophosphatase MutT (NUDIX family)